MLSQSLDGLQSKLWEILEIRAAYGHVLRKFQSAIFFHFFGQLAINSDSLYDYDTLYKHSLDESDENWERSRVLTK